MEFKKGQIVLCIDDHFNYGQSRLKKGNVYTIQDFYKCPCGSDQLILLEIPDIITMRCKCGSTIFRRQSYYNWRFISMEYSEKFKETSLDNIEVMEEVVVS